MTTVKKNYKYLSTVWKGVRVGRRSSPAKRVYGLKPVSRVQIPAFPPFFSKILILLSVFLNLALIILVVHFTGTIKAFFMSKICVSKSVNRNFNPKYDSYLFFRKKIITKVYFQLIYNYNISIFINKHNIIII